MKSPLKLQQNQVYNLGDSYVRIVSLERLQVKYKALKNISSRDGHHFTVTKKEFCRLIKTALLVTPEEMKKMWAGTVDVPDKAAPEA